GGARRGGPAAARALPPRGPRVGRPWRDPSTAPAAAPLHDRRLDGPGARADGGPPGDLTRVGPRWRLHELPPADGYAGPGGLGLCGSLLPARGWDSGGVVGAGCVNRRARRSSP